MSCPTHGTACAYQTPSDERCIVCHCTWTKITAPAEIRTDRTTHNRKGEPITVTDVIYLDGYGETREAHTARHDAAAKRVEDGRRKRANKDAA